MEAEHPPDSTPSAPRRRWPLPVYPFELAAVAAAVLAALFLWAMGMRMDWRTADYIFSPLYRYIPRGLLAGVAAYALYAALRRESVTDYLRRVATLGWLALWVRLWIASAVLTYGYFWLKVTIPLITDRLVDLFLWRVDVVLHLGVSPSVFLTQAFAGTWLVPAIDAWYAIWIPSVFYSIAFFSAFPDDLFRRRFMFSCVLLWTLGSWLYVSLPALGPIYVTPEVWQHLAGSMPRAEGGQLVLWENYERMLAGRSGVLRQFNPTRGIAAMPSLHVAAHWLFALWARHRARPLFVPFAIATLLTFIGSVLTGWHYAVDGYVGIGLAWVCYRIALIAERGGREERRQELGVADEGAAGAVFDDAGEGEGAAVGDGVDAG